MWPKVWHVACTTDHIANPGDWFEHRLGRYSILLVRGDDGALRGFQNVCRHRGNTICRGSGTGMNELRCPYHRWAWDLAGRLRDSPASIRPAGRRSVAGAGAGGHLGPPVFVNLDLDAEPLDDWLEGIPADIAWANLDEFRGAYSTVTAVNCNWKVVNDGFSETYHVRGPAPRDAGQHRRRQLFPAHLPPATARPTRPTACPAPVWAATWTSRRCGTPSSSRRAGAWDRSTESPAELPGHVPDGQTPPRRDRPEDQGPSGHHGHGCRATTPLRSLTSASTTCSPTPPCWPVPTCSP